MGTEDAPPSVVVRPLGGVAKRLSEAVSVLRDVPGFVSAAVARRDGLVIHHTLKTGREAAVLCAMTAVMVTSSRTTGEHLKGGSFLHSIVRYADLDLVIAEAGSEAILACLLARGANLGLALMKMKSAAKLVEEALDAL